MRQFRFTEVLLLVACTLLPPLFVNGIQVLHSTVNYNAQRKDAVIRGLLVTRQHYCSTGYFICESKGCCPRNWHCCRDGNCCDPSSFCVFASNGVIGCCPNGEICTGPAGDPRTINLPPTTQTVTRRPTTTSRSTSKPSTTRAVGSTSFDQNPLTPSSSPTEISETQALVTSTGLSPFSSATKRAQPYRPLLVFVGALLVVVYCA